MQPAKQLQIGDFVPESDANIVSFQSVPVKAEVQDDLGDCADGPIKCMPSSEGHEAINQIVRLIESNYYNFGGWSNAFDTILDVILYALTRNEDEYLRVVKTLKKEALDCTVKVYSILFKALYYDFCIQDILGEVYMRVGSLSKSKHFGQFFTPFHVCMLMAEINMGDIKSLIVEAKEKGKKITINDPCVGSGAMLIACKRVILEKTGIEGLDYFEFYGMDIDRTCINICKIQMILTDYRYMASLLISEAFKIKQAKDVKESKKEIAISIPVSS